MGWLFPVVNKAGEQSSSSPTKTLTNIVESAGLTPGGLEPANNVPTLGKMQAGGFTMKWVVAIEGCKYLLSDAPSASVLAAWAGHDATQVLGGLFVENVNSQSISPDDPFPAMGRLILSVLDVTGEDTFGIYVNKRSFGDKTTLTATTDRNDTTLAVKRGTDFTAPSDVYIGTECVGVTGAGASSLTGATRGKYSALGCDSTGSGGNRFARHHRVTTDVTTTLSNPVVSEVPRSWIGKHVSLYLHTYDRATGQMNTRSAAQLVYAGRIVGISNGDTDTVGHTKIEVEHIAAEFKNAVIGKDQLAGEITQGLYLVEGRVFRFTDIVVDGSPAYTAPSNLVVVAGAPATAYEIQAGYYNGDELTAALSRWLATAKSSGTIEGNYTWSYAVSSNVGPRTKCYWRVTNASNFDVQWTIEMPGEVAAFLGLRSNEDAGSGQQVAITVAGKTANVNVIFQGDLAPYSTLIFKPSGPGSIGQEFADYAIKYELENERGEFVDQFDFLPASIKGASQNDTSAALFLLDDKCLMVASYDEATATISNCWLAPFQLGGDNSAEAVNYIGRRVDEPQAPVTIKQVLLLEGPFKDIVSKIVYSTGVAGYNHATYDVLPFSLGVGMPGQLLGPEWDRSLANLPGADAPIAILIDEPVKFGDLFRDDFRIRRAFIRWRDQGFEFCTWRTPMVADAQHTLNEGNKAEPAGQEGDHRVASQETDQWFVSSTTIQYCRDFGSDRGAKYLREINLEDQSGSDLGGGVGRKQTIKLRNTFAQFANAGTPVENLIAKYLEGIPMFRPSPSIVRSLNSQQYESIVPGEIVLVYDNEARDPLTGERGINGRAFLVTRVSYTVGGPMPNGSVRDMSGEVEMFALDTQRGGVYSPAAELDPEKNYAGFLAGYNATTSTLWLAPSNHSLTLTVMSRRGPVTHTLGRDADSFSDGDEIIICEIDPTDTAAPTYWQRTVNTRTGDFVSLTSALSAPAFDSSKRYRVFPAQYTDCTTLQQDHVFQADSADEMIQDEEVADQFSSTAVNVTFTPTSSSDLFEFIPDLAWGDGKPLDVGIDAAMAKNANALIDYRLTHQQPSLWSESALGGPGPGTSFATISQVRYSGIYHFGSDMLSGAITRTLTIALWLRSATGSAAYARVTLSRLPPTNLPSLADGVLGAPFGYPMFGTNSSRSDIVTTTSTTWFTTADMTVDIAVKDLQWGCAWLVVELSGDSQCRGPAKMVVGSRTVAT